MSKSKYIAMPPYITHSSTTQYQKIPPKCDQQWSGDIEVKTNNTVVYALISKLFRNLSGKNNKLGFTEIPCCIGNKSFPLPIESGNIQEFLG